MRPSALRKRLWQAGFALGLFIAIAVIANPFLPPDKAVTHKSAGFDFLAFYTAGTFVRTGQSGELYNLASVRQFQQRIIRDEHFELRPEAVGPFWNPPLFACLFVPLSILPYDRALNTWLGFNALCFVGAMCILCSILRSVETTPFRSPEQKLAVLIDWRTWGLLPLLTVTSIPFIEALGHGQNSCLSLLIVSLVVLLWRAGHGLRAGLVLGLLFYKPQLSCALAVALVVTCGWRAVVGLLISGAGVLSATIITLPGTLLDFLRKLPANLHYMQIDRVYLWDRHVTLNAFWRLLVQGFEIGPTAPITRVLTIISVVAIGACLLAALWKVRRQRNAISRDRAISLTIVLMPLMMPFYFDYDLLLLVIPLTLLAREMITTRSGLDRRLVAGWAVLYGWLICNSWIAIKTHVNGAVILLLIIGVMMIRRLDKRSSNETELLAMDRADRFSDRAGGGDLEADSAQAQPTAAGGASAGCIGTALI